MNLPHEHLLTSEMRRRTFRLDLVRGFFRGILSAGTQTFALFIAIRYFEAGYLSKSLIGSAPFIGMLLSMLWVHWVSYTRLSKARAAALPAVGCGLFLLTAGFASSAPAYTACVVGGFIGLHLLTPFLTSIYHDNYPDGQRGAYFARPMMVTVLVSVVTGFAGSWLMDQNIENYRWLLVALGIAGLGKAGAIAAMPSGPVDGGRHRNPLNNFKYMFEDRSFGYVLLTWFIMGFANLWVLPLRVDYVTSSTYGIEGSALFVALVITVIPDLMRAVAAPFLARMFDRMNFIVLRMIINVVFALGILLFFATDDPWVIALGAALIGIAFGGGTIAWGLWVTKYAPPDKVAAYMSVHVCLTGVRGTVGPLIGFWAVGFLGPVNIGWVSFALMILATLMLIPEIRHGRRGFVETGSGS